MNIQSRGSVDWITVTIYLALLVIGWLMLYASSYDESQSYPYLNFSTIIGKQTIWIGASLLVFVAALAIDWKFWNSLAYPIYFTCLALLLAVLIFGIEVKGARSWFGFSGFSIQPSELAKFGTVLAMASYLSYYKSDLRDMKSILVSLGLIVVPMILILMQPDAGSALVFTSFLLLFYRNGLSPSLYLVGGGLISILILSLVYSPNIVMLLLVLIGIGIFANKIKQKRIALVVGIALIAGVITLFVYQQVLIAFLVAFTAVICLGAYAYFNRHQRLVLLIMPMVLAGSFISFGSRYAFDNGLKPHQQERINVWLRPDKCDPRGSLYNILQSKMAISGGGFQGKGFLEGDLTKLNYVPEQTTDFIFSTVGEEQGFIGVVSVILLFLGLLIRTTVIAERAKNKFIANYAYGVVGIIFVHFFVNIGMSMGVMPVIGIPLPFLSKGGSALLTFSVMIGVLVKMDTARFGR